MSFIVRQIKFLMVVVIVILLFGIAYRVEPRLGLVDLEYEIVVEGTMVKENFKGPFQFKSEWSYRPTFSKEGKYTVIKLTDSDQIAKNSFKTIELSLIVGDPKTIVDGTKIDVKDVTADMSRGAASYKETITSYIAGEKEEEVFEADEASGWIEFEDVEKLKGRFSLIFRDFDEAGNFKMIKLQDAVIDVNVRRT